MRNFLRSWRPLFLRRRGSFVAPRLEQLENRIVFALSASPLTFTAAGTADAAAALMAPNDFQLYQVQLQAGDMVTASVSSQASGGALQSNLRIFDATGRQLALDAQKGGDARLTFQAATTGSYLVGVSAAGDDAYDPSVVGSGKGGATTGLYTLDLQRQTAALTPDLAGSSFQLQTNTAAYGDTVTAKFTVDNRGGAAAGAFEVQVVLSPDNLFGPSSWLLTTFALTGLGVGQEFNSGAFTMSLPDPAQTTAFGLPASGPVYVGLRIDPSGVVPELNPHDQSGVHAGADWQTLTVVTPVAANGNNYTQASAQALSDLNSRVNGMLAPGQTDWYQLTVSSDMQLTAAVTAATGDLLPRLTLAGSKGQVLIQSDGSLVQHLPAGTYLLEVSTYSGAGQYQLTVSAVPASAPIKPLSVSSYVSDMAVADVNGDGKPDLVVVNWYDGNLGVLLGNGDGTFEPQQTVYDGYHPWLVTAADVNGDGKPDLVVVDAGTYDSSTQKWENGNVSILLGKGDGTFASPQSFDDGYNPQSVVVADVNGDGKPDLLVDNAGTYNSTTGNYDNAGTAVLLGNGNGAFGNPQIVTASQGLMAVADVNGDGKADLLVESAGTYNSTTGKYDNAGVNVLLGNGDGTFQNPQFVAVGNAPLSGLMVTDVNGDGKPDLVVVNRSTYDSTTGKYDNASVNVLLGKGDGTFQNAKTTSIAGDLTYSMQVADVNGDGIPDLVASDEYGSQVGVMLGIGDGYFQAPQTSQVFSYGWKPSLAVADFNGDGKPDIVAASGYGGQVAVLLGNGDGAFQSPQPSHAVATGTSFPSVTVADVNKDGNPDLITAGGFFSSSSSASLLLGNGDGTFQPPQTIKGASYSVTVADLNGDGKPDLIDATGKVFLGNGDGTFQRPKSISKGSLNVLAVVDVNGDGKPDVLTSSYDYDSHSTTLSLWLGKGDGAFQTGQSLYTFKNAWGLKVLTEADDKGDGKVSLPDINGDGKPDLVVSYYSTNNNGYYSSNSYTRVLLGKGDGAFQSPQNVPNGSSNVLAVADVNGDGKSDLITANYDYSDHSTTVTVLLGDSDGSFQPVQTTIPGYFSTYNGVFVADVNGDGKPDLVVSNYWSYSSGTYGIQVLLGKGDGAFQPSQPIANGYYSSVVAVSDVNGDGRPDLITSGFGDGLRVLLGNASGGFTLAAPTTAGSPRNIPYVADLTGDNVPDSVILNSDGAILFRKGLPGGDNSFAPPVTLNPGPSGSYLPSRPARDLTVLRTAEGMAIATADAKLNSTAPGGSQTDYTVSLYRYAADGAFQRTTAFKTTLQPTRIIAHDLTGNGLDDIIVANSTENSIQIAYQQSDGTFSAQPDGSLPGQAVTLSTGQSPSDITVADFNGDGLPDIAVSNQDSGDVTVFLNDSRTDPQHPFSQSNSYIYRAGTGLYGLDITDATGDTAAPVITDQEQTVSLAAGNFTGSSGGNDLVVVNRGSDSLSVLANDRQGGFANPQPVLTTSTRDGTEFSTQAGQVIAGQFHGPGAPTDLAVLMQDLGQVWIYTGNGDGAFHHTFSISAGDQPTGLNMVLNPQTGFEDLLVGDSFGDVLRLQGKGDGTFQAAGRRTTLAVQDLGNGHTDVLVANQQSDSVTIQASNSSNSQITPVVTLADGTDSTLAPGYVQWAKLDQSSPYYDAVVVASGGNEILVYRGTGFDAAGNPTFAAPVSYAVGTNPVSVSIQDINDDGIPDLIVANQGSNDVSLVFGSWDDNGDWVGTLGPRLKSGGSGPIAVQAIFPASGGNPELMITNGQSGTLTLLPGVGGGNFNDQNPQVINLPGNPVLTQGPTFFASTSQGVLLTATGQLIGFNVDEQSGNVDNIETLFTSQPDEGIVAAQALVNGHVVAALSNGSVVDLAPAEDGLLTLDATYIAQTGIPVQPSALAVLQEESETQVLVTSAGESTVFAFSIPPTPEGELPPGETTGPLVGVSPVEGEPLTVVATLTAGAGLPGETITTTTLIGNELVAEEGEIAEAELSNLGLAAVGTGSPAWALGLLTRLLTTGLPDDPAEDVVVVADAKAAVTGKTPLPTPDGLDLDKLLRELDLYQPPRNPEPPASISIQPKEERGQEVIALTSATDVETLLADLAETAADEAPPRWRTSADEVVAAMVADETVPAHATASDAVLEQMPSSWSTKCWQLLGLTGLTLWPWPGYGSKPDGQSKPKLLKRRGSERAADPKGK